MKLAFFITLTVLSVQAHALEYEYTCYNIDYSKTTKIAKFSMKFLKASVKILFDKNTETESYTITDFKSSTLGLEKASMQLTLKGQGKSSNLIDPILNLYGEKLLSTGGYRAIDGNYSGSMKFYQKGAGWKNYSCYRTNNY